MSRGEYAWRHDYRAMRGLYRDRENGWIFGVCAGIAEYLNFRAGTLRIIAVICLLLFFWPTVLVYVAATLLLKSKPLMWSGRCREYEFWQRHGRRDEWRHS